MPERNREIYLQDILSSCVKIKKYTAGLNASLFAADDKTFDAVIRNFEIIGEASKKIGDKIKHSYPDIPWRDLIDFRNRISHEYFGISVEIVWKIIQDEIPSLESKIKKIQTDEK